MGFGDFLRILASHHGRGGHHGGHHGGHDSHNHGNGGYNYGYSQPSAPYAPAQEEQRPCPKCAKLVSAGFKFCSSCGASLEPALCKGCGAKLPPAAVFCSGCGAKVLG